ncbi:MAG: DUF434 domain-containing protein [Myxococcales bacterium]|nr:DUF434 domain-containing protein [Myxococcales bacterium]
MPDTRAHRGPHPRDSELFSTAWLAPLRAAVADLAWLLGRGYATASALKLVGDRHALRERQRTAVLRATCSDAERADRLARRRPLGGLAGAVVAIDGFNVLTTVEAALAGGVVLRGRDGCHRDMASMHGSYRRVAETAPAARAVAAVLHDAGVAGAIWYLDRPVSNSGRLAAGLAELAAEAGLSWQVELVADPDPVLAAAPTLVATADSGILDRCGGWVDLARHAVERVAPAAWVLDLAPDC